MDETTHIPHPAWSYPAVIYELNVRQLTPEGTFAAAEKHLPRLRELGIDGKVLISSGTGGSGPELAHVMGAVIITAGFLLLWLFVRRVIRIASEKNKKKDG